MSDTLVKRDVPDDLLTEYYSVDLSSLLMAGMEEMLDFVSVLCGCENPVVRMDGGEVVIGEQDPSVGWRERLVQLTDGILFAFESGVSDDRDQIARLVLEADGWSFTPVALRTPTWMEDVQELSRSDVAAEFEVFKWIETSI